MPGSWEMTVRYFVEMLASCHSPTYKQIGLQLGSKLRGRALKEGVGRETEMTQQFLPPTSPETKANNKT